MMVESSVARGLVGLGLVRCEAALGSLGPPEEKMGGGKEVRAAAEQAALEEQRAVVEMS